MLATQPCGQHRSFSQSSLYMTSYIASSEKWDKVSRIYISIAVGILIFTAALKLITLVKAWNELDNADVFFPFLSHRAVLFVAALMELVISSIIICSRTNIFKIFSILWLCFVFVAYRIGLHGAGFAKDCECLGRLNSLFKVELLIKNANKLSDIFLLYLVIGSLFLIVWNRIISLRSGRAIKQTI
jgi:hypothetical protein